jgi:hypothetical protein
MMLVALLGVLAVGVWGAFAVFAASPGPTVSSFTLSGASPTNASSMSWKVVFSSAVTGVAASNFTPVPGGAVAVSGSPTVAVVNSSTYTVTVNTTVFSGSGTLGLNLTSAGSIKDSSNKALQGTPYTGPVYTVDKTPPTVSSINRSSATPTNASSLSWAVSFSEPVSGVDTTDFALAVSGLTGASISAVSGSGATYTVTAASGSGNGNLGLNLNDNDSILDAVGNKLGGTGTGTVTSGGTGNGSFTGQVYAIDKTAPSAPTITSGPSGSGNPSSATFNFSDAEGGVTYLCKLDSGSYVACSNPATFSGLADGSHTLTVEAKDAAGNVSAPSLSRTWSVDATGPPKPTIVGPNNNNPSTVATFTFSDTEANVTFKCQMDGGGYTGCTSPKTYLLPAGTHVFDVEPIDQAQNVGPFNEWKWTINGNSGAGMPFTIDGNAVGLLYPGGPSQSIAVTFHNPNSVPIYVTAFTTALSSTLPAGCQATWFPIGQSNISSSNTVTVPAKVGSVNGSVTLPHLNSIGTSTVTAPTIVMSDFGDQTACHGAQLQINYTLGSAQS